MTTALLVLRQTLILDNRRTRRLGGLAITVTGLALLAMATLESVTQWPPAVQQALMATLATALAT
ncbi:MAG: hypothetical protein Q8J78_09660, partial [Moraxellaceae bacterium]|nr:hypothetical protein [Moraxellaceae bacterium]